MRPTSLVRSLAPWRPAIAWIWFASWVVVVTTWHSHGFDAGVRGGLVVLVAWAITRELAPQRWLAAALAPFAAVAFAIPADSDVLACLVVLLAVRISARSVGDRPTSLDLIGLIGLVAWSATRPTGLPVVLVLAAAVFVDEPRRRTRLAGGAMLVVALIVGSVEGTLTVRPGIDEHPLAALILLGGAVAASMFLVLKPVPKRLRVRDDRRRGQLRGARVRAARVIAVASVIATIAWTGTHGAFALSAVSAALLASALGGASLPPARSARSGIG